MTPILPSCCFLLLHPSLQPIHLLLLHPSLQPIHLLLLHPSLQPIHLLLQSQHLRCMALINSCQCCLVLPTKLAQGVSTNHFFQLVLQAGNG